MSVRSFWSIMFCKSTASLLIFYLDILSIIEVSYYYCIADNFSLHICSSFIYLDPVMLGTYIIVKSSYRIGHFIIT